MSNTTRIDRRTALAGALAAGLASGAAVTASAASEAQGAAGTRKSMGKAAPAPRMRAWEVGERGADLTLRMVERPIPVPGPGQVLLRVLATGINAVDIAAITGQFFNVGGPTMIPLQDNASEVVALGPGVSGFAIGDRVTTTLYIEWITGAWDTAYMRSMPGLGIDGFLAEYVLMPATTLVHLPARLDDVQACTLAIAGLTAWRALAIEAKVKPGETVVTTGTGGVSTFNLQIAKMFGARVIVTSSSDEKLERMKSLGADLTINYRTTADWAQAVLDLTGGQGADVVLNNVGWPETVNSLRACRSSARLIHIGSGRSRTPMPNWPNMITKNVWMKSFTMAGRNMLENFLAAMQHNSLVPIVDRVFAFEEAPDAVRFMQSGDRIGKIAIRVAAESPRPAPTAAGAAR
jgi:NADPH:quinone reductase-like Zn-dependent oxidoreductase